jgi:hypothetical protein
VEISGVEIHPAQRVYCEIAVTYANARGQLKYAFELRRYARAQPSHVPSLQCDDRARDGERLACGGALRFRDAKQQNDGGRWKNDWPWMTPLLAGL